MKAHHRAGITHLRVFGEDLPAPVVVKVLFLGPEEVLGWAIVVHVREQWLGEHKHVLVRRRPVELSQHGGLGLLPALAVHSTQRGLSGHHRMIALSSQQRVGRHGD